MSELDKQDDNKPERDSKGRILPGYSGNPKGRPPGNHAFAEAVRDYGDMPASAITICATVAKKYGLDPATVTIRELAAADHWVKSLLGKAAYNDRIWERTDGPVSGASSDVETHRITAPFPVTPPDKRTPE